MRNNMKKLLDFLNKYGRILAGLGVLICVAGLVLSYVKPKQKLETITINMSAEGETVLELAQGTVIEYICDTKGYAMSGIQVGISKYGNALAEGAMLCSVYTEDREVLLSQTLISVGELDEGQYVYIPFENYEQCIGTILVEFTYTDPSGAVMGLMANTAELEDAVTVVNGIESKCQLKSYYVYRLDYYPLLFDLSILLFMFVGAFMLTGNKKEKIYAPGAAAEREAADE